MDVCVCGEACHRWGKGSEQVQGLFRRLKLAWITMATLPACPLDSQSLEPGYTRKGMVEQDVGPGRNKGFFPTFEAVDKQKQKPVTKA